MSSEKEKCVETKHGNRMARCKASGAIDLPIPWIDVPHPL